MNPSWLKNHDVRSFAFKPIIVKTYCIKPVCDVALRFPMRELLFESFEGNPYALKDIFRPTAI